MCVCVNVMCVGLCVRVCGFVRGRVCVFVEKNTTCKISDT